MAKRSGQSRIVHLQLTCLKAPLHPPDVIKSEFGLQDRAQEIRPGQLQADGSLLYEIDVEALQQNEASEARLRSPYVQGTPAVPFLYLSLRRLAPGPVSWIKRLKVPLPRLPWEHIATTQALPCFAASVSGEGSGTVVLSGNGWIQRDYSVIISLDDPRS
ncbi:MAG TPA: DUF5990 family protein [Ktedonobacteraceae bacterium]|nr:DUF5990 family protein [Ktedonobacteraceae bacterium]